jgi:hypothetical protein
MFENFRVRMTSFYLTKLYPLSNFDRLYLSQYRSYKQTSNHSSAIHFGQRRGFGPHQDVIDIFLMTHKVLQVKHRYTIETIGVHWTFTAIIAVERAKSL